MYFQALLLLSPLLLLLQPACGQASSSSHLSFGMAQTDAPACATSDLSALMPPLPTGTVSVLLYSLVSAVTAVPSVTYYSQCAYTTLLKPADSSPFFAYGSAVSSWVAVSSAAILDSEKQCPNAWERLGEAHLTDIALAEFCSSCVVVRQRSGVPTTVTIGTWNSAGPTTTNSPPAPTTKTPNAAAGRGAGAGAGAASLVAAILVVGLGRVAVLFTN